MSRIGKLQLTIPVGVIVTTGDQVVTVKGPKGELKRIFPREVKIVIVDNTVSVDVVNKEEKKERALWGTFAAHIKNMVTGVTVGFKKELEINGVGFRVAMQGKDLKMEVGFSHSVIYKVPAGAVVSVEKNVIKIESFDIELLGKVAAEIRGIKRPEPYKGKGIRYVGEVVHHKAGKAAAKAAA
ncbi:MAG: 50S ribosomal protein L6 [Candidatus Magasanikbacteria bacterium RIFCSPLOWO2_01_FULL_43_20b]|uniref:50S ribosomal protein L6 n=1 Tax=Candidatus Magasanikbacteria bacterium RIFCSPLOWO2_12_FULL_43_12 TaxID=1798692 RepID=A0A1F6MTY1_9BACT|nr:MAG: 50S ribosomal protein L6 [Candidatus Magasanikbacteria bacterium RIFCSPHIGHO2_02_FULL_44_13]OGH71905.1 MAG: 50S ribosomal protein L6 [Candidatus Magasanikbacteria bacterium RIFCSPLOWO2_02_FULL_43_22]OGH73541.1 MAG: 50S ribosomal protein L6 [Candidatus Magasanikbacteria bacterium RIFCSPLOWO2_01_FULL_43_20b]OGH75072.1 MAG: 50S ribosomal protein L6 [Candidatus Magasanikbacteria bacterium RIFCSPLOWO2_12_FULL_43_12]